MTLKKNYPTTPKTTNKDESKQGKIKYRKERQRQKEAEDEIKKYGG